MVYIIGKYRQKLTIKYTSQNQTVALPPRYPDQVLHFFETEHAKGLCVGASVLWSYASYISEFDSENPRDDLEYFNKMIIKIANLDDNSTQTEDPEIERFISLVHLLQMSSYPLFQNGGLQLDLKNLLHTTKGKIPHKYLDEKLTCDKHILKRKISTFLKKNRLLFISANSHIISIHTKKDGRITFFDLNQGEIKANDINELSEIIWESLNKGLFEPLNYIYPLDHYGIREFNFHGFLFIDDKNAKHTSAESFEILPEDINRILNNNIVLSHQKHPLVSKFINQLTDDQVINFINSTNVERFNFREKCAKIADNLIKKINKIYFKSIPYSKAEADKLISQAIKYAKILNLDEVFQILALRPGDLQLVETLMLGCNREIPKYSFSLFVVLHENLNAGHLETAKQIAAITIETFYIKISIKTIIDLGNVDFANFIHEKYETIIATILAQAKQNSCQ